MNREQLLEIALNSAKKAGVEVMKYYRTDDVKTTIKVLPPMIF